MKLLLLVTYFALFTIPAVFAQKPLQNGVSQSLFNEKILLAGRHISTVHMPKRASRSYPRWA
jgi:hypothetical protein